MLTEPTTSKIGAQETQEMMEDRRGHNNHHNLRTKLRKTRRKRAEVDAVSYAEASLLPFLSLRKQYTGTYT